MKHLTGYLTVACILFLEELCVKNHAEKYFQPSDNRQALKGLLVLRKYHNRGAFLNAGESRQKIVASVSVALTALVAVALWKAAGIPGLKLCKIGLSLMLGGGLSNTTDRLMRGYVVDYMSLRCGDKRIDNIVFNMADLYIMIGALLALTGDDRQAFLW